jgi:hypothetical protein
MSVTSDIGPVVSEVVLASMGLLTMGGGLRIWREKPKLNPSSEDRRPQWMLIGAMPTGICVMSLAIAFPLSYGLQDRIRVLANLCFYFGGFFFALAALCAVTLAWIFVLLFFERPMPRFLTPPSRRTGA